VSSCRFMLPPKPVWSCFGNFTTKNEFSDKA
jgi:hypothetical protein